MQAVAPPHSSWQELLASPASGSHLLQMYGCQDFLAAGVAHFVVEGLRRGEAVLLSGTAIHLARIRAQLSRLDVDLDAAQRHGLVALGPVEEVLASLTANGALRKEDFSALIDQVLQATRARADWTGVRWWAEFANTVHAAGDEACALRIEEAAAEAADRHGISIFCSAQCDRFDARHYPALERLCRMHTHIIPANDYAGHRIAVNRAIAEEIGELRGSHLHALSNWKGLACELPSSQALLFWLREAMPERFEAVLARAKSYVRPATAAGA
ncbi:MAG TPA: MEDS domain-containing protein [Burkholderiales bacterium]|nr:MEDS domain-containing protein [Burkholderiales bacterium]